MKYLGLHSKQRQKGNKKTSTPDLLRKKVLEKLENPQLYVKLDDDPLQNLKKELFELWKKGKVEKHISPNIAYRVAGVTENDNMSTSPVYKPGVPYFYPMLKIHKLRVTRLRHRLPSPRQR